MKKKKLLTGILVASLLFLVIGISLALYFSDQIGSDNAINTGKVSFTYTEPSNTVVLNNALPQDDNTGKVQTNYFDFSVASNATTNEDDDNGVEVPYEISLSPVVIDNLLSPLNNDDIKVYLTRLDEETETEVLAPTKISELSQAQYRENAFKLLKEKDSFHNNAPAKTTRYRLRFWIDSSVDASNWNENGKYQYKFVVNVNAKANKADNSNKLSSHIKSLYTIENNAMTVADNGTSYIKGEYEESYSESPTDIYLYYFGYYSLFYMYQNKDGSFDEESIINDFNNFFAKEGISEQEIKKEIGPADNYLDYIKALSAGIIIEDENTHEKRFAEGYTKDDIPTLEEIVNDETLFGNFSEWSNLFVYIINVDSFNNKYKQGNNYNFDEIDKTLIKGMELMGVPDETFQLIKDEFGSFNNYLIAETFDYIDYDEDDNLILKEGITIEDLPKLEDILAPQEGPVYIQNNFIKINDMLWQIYGVNSDNSLNIIFAGILKEDASGDKDFNAIKTSYKTSNSFLETETARLLGFGDSNVENAGFLKLIENTTLKNLLKKKQYTYKEDGIDKTYDGYFAFMTEEEYERSISNGLSFLIPYIDGDIKFPNFLPIFEYTVNNSNFKVLNNEHGYYIREDVSAAPILRMTATISDIDEYSGDGTILDPYVLDEEEKTTDLAVAYTAMNFSDNNFYKHYRYYGWNTGDIYFLLENYGYENHNVLKVGDLYRFGVVVNGKCYYNKDNNKTLVEGDLSNCDSTNFNYNDVVTYSKIEKYTNNEKVENLQYLLGTQDEYQLKVKAYASEKEINNIQYKWEVERKDENGSWQYETLTDGIEKGVKITGSTSGNLTIHFTDIDEFDKYQIDKIRCYSAYDNSLIEEINFSEIEGEIVSVSSNKEIVEDSIDVFIGETIDLEFTVKNASAYGLNHTKKSGFITDWGGQFSEFCFSTIDKTNLKAEKINTKIDKEEKINVSYTITMDDYKEHGCLQDDNTYITLILNLSSGDDYYLTVNLLPTRIINQPQGLTVEKNDTAVFKVDAEGATSYQWQKKVNDEWINVNDIENKVSGSKTDTLSVVAIDEMPDETIYRCVLEGTETLYTDEVNMKIVITDGDWLYKEVLDNDDIPTGDYEVVKFVGDYDNSKSIEVAKDYFNTSWYENIVDSNELYMEHFAEQYVRVLENLRISPKVFEKIAVDYFDLEYGTSTEKEIVSKTLQVYYDESILNSINFDEYTSGEIDGYKVTLPIKYLDYDVIGANGLLFMDDMYFDDEEGPDPMNVYYYGILLDYVDNDIEPTKLKFNQIVEITVPEGYDYLGKSKEELNNYSGDLEYMTSVSGFALKNTSSFVLGFLNFLEHISLPESLTEIGNFALYGISTYVSSLKAYGAHEPLEIVVPKNVKKIHSFTFSYAGYGMKIAFEEGSVCDEFENYAFAGQVLSFNVPASVERIGNRQVLPVNWEVPYSSLSEVIFENTIENPSQLKSCCWGFNPMASHDAKIEFNGVDIYSAINACLNEVDNEE